MTHTKPAKRIGEILVDLGFIGIEEVNRALLQEGGYLGQKLLNAGVIDEEALAQALALQFDLEYVPGGQLVLQEELCASIPPEIGLKINAIPVAKEGDEFLFAIENPLRLFEADDFLRRKGYLVRWAIAPATPLRQLLSHTSWGKKHLQNQSEHLTTPPAQSHPTLAPAEDQGPLSTLVDQILTNALAAKASDIHIENHSTGVRIKFRLDGVLSSTLEDMDKKLQTALLSRFKLMANLDIAERRLPQDGRFRRQIAGREIDFRVSTMPGVFGEDLVLRILDKNHLMDKKGQLSLQSLFYDSELLNQLRSAIAEPQGLFLVVGPTGSGKTTTLYACLNQLDRTQEKVITIEDPVEYHLEGTLQIQINERKGLTFAKGLRSILRHDPDKLMIGEIRDPETLQVATQAALTGHLVFSTVHANSSFDVFHRFEHLGLNRSDFVSSLNCIVSQRLLRRLCPKCKQYADPAEENSPEWREFPPMVATGCPACNHTGYLGRVAAVELLIMDKEIKEILLTRQTFLEAFQVAQQKGMKTLRQNALGLVQSGETSISEMYRVIGRSA